MTRKFWKMHGIGNDYIFFDCFAEELYEPEKLAVRLSDRHYSVGGDGIILVTKSAVADGGMRMFNADGSEGKMCGNGIRCVGKFLYEIKGIHKRELTVETLSGIKTLYLSVNGGEVSRVTVDMGKAVFSPQEIPVKFDGKEVVNRVLEVDGKDYRATCLSMGNPHCVVFGDPNEIERAGRSFETHSAFPHSVNTEFVKVCAKNELAMRVWERGSGETLACGTGACAAAVAAVKNGFCEEEADITVHLRGGDLTVHYTGGAVSLTGPAEHSFSGEVQI
ncbi:MAG: diaminopimelate epimerase [Clostridiales bacterium]|nr:diaminopimelate epimerase [Clostridiales bacterium]